MCVLEGLNQLLSSFSASYPCFCIPLCDVGAGTLNHISGGAWVAQSVKHLTLGFGSGHDLTVCEFESSVRLHTNETETPSDGLSPSLSAPPTSVSLSK